VKHGPGVQAGLPGGAAENLPRGLAAPGFAGSHHRVKAVDPFEAAEQWAQTVIPVGNDAPLQAAPGERVKGREPIVVVLPGSRRAEMPAGFVKESLARRAITQPGESLIPPRRPVRVATNLGVSSSGATPVIPFLAATSA
jgi:hypothetical protein